MEKRFLDRPCMTVARATSRRIVDLPARCGGAAIASCRSVLRLLLENVLRCSTAASATRAARRCSAGSRPAPARPRSPFQPGRVLMHDTTCSPALVDIAAHARRARRSRRRSRAGSTRCCRSTSRSTTPSPSTSSARPTRSRATWQREIGRNAERYRFMKWATRALRGVRVHPPGTGIMHTINLERLATRRHAREQRDGAALGRARHADRHRQPHADDQRHRRARLGRRRARGRERDVRHAGDAARARRRRRAPRRAACAQGVLATDLALTVTERLRRIERRRIDFVEFFGPGVSTLSAGERAVVANMAPGIRRHHRLSSRSTTQTLRLSARRPAAAPTHIALRRGLRQGGRASGSIRRRRRATPSTIEIDLDAVEISLAGPRRPQDRLPPARPADALAADARGRRVGRCSGCRGTARSPSPRSPAAPTPPIRGCSIAAGLLARKARALGLTPPAWVKTSLAPGSPTAERYLRRAGLLEDLEALGFGIVGYGCTTCIGNSGPLPPVDRRGHGGRGIVPVAVLSGNRNFPGRVHPQTRGRLPRLAAAGRRLRAGRRRRSRHPRATRSARSPPGGDVRLADLWPSGDEIDAALAARASTPAISTPPIAEAEAQRGLARARCAGDAAASRGTRARPYLRRPPFAGFGKGTLLGRYAAHPLLVLGDDITTDHISPAGRIPPDSEAGRLSRRARRGPRRPQRLRLAPRQLGGDAARRCSPTKSVAQPARPADRRRASRFMRRAASVLPLWRRGRALRATRATRSSSSPASATAWARRATGPRRARRLLGVRAVLAVELRAHPSLQPDRHGHPAAAPSRRRSSAHAGAAPGRPHRGRCGKRHDRAAAGASRCASCAPTAACSTSTRTAAVETQFEARAPESGRRDPDDPARYDTRGATARKIRIMTLDDFAARADRRADPCRRPAGGQPPARAEASPTGCACRARR